MATRRRNRRRPAVDPRIEELEETKRLCTDFFGELRRGFAYGYDPNRRGDIIDNIVHPKHGRWRGMQDPFRSGVRQPQVTRARAMFAAAIPQTPGRLAPRAKQRLQDAYSATFRLNQNFTPAHVTFRKILGYGGFGVAALFGLHDSTGREVTTVVKADLRPGHGPGDTIKTEKKNLVLMSGAKHVVQRTLLIAFPWPDDVPMRIDYFWAATRFLIKLFIFHLKVITLFMLTSLQITIWLVENFMELVLGVRMVAEGDDPDAADNQDPQPAAAQPDPAQPDDAEQPPAEADPQIGPIPSLQSWNMKKLWPDWPKAPPRALGIDGSIRQNRIELDAREDIISMEYLKFGDLGKWIGKMTVENNTEPESVFSERLAWIIFECLWRGCVALAYPTGFYQGNDPMAVQIPQVTESSETSAVGPEDPMVHFDLDPQNIFVGDFASDHPLWPLTKIGDLGLSLQPKWLEYDDDLDEESKRWIRRRRGKRDSLLPEQITEEWDYVPNLNALRNHEVAGNYDSHSNIYHIGLTMFELLTLNLPDDPPTARPYSFRIDRQSLSGWTYGHNLLAEFNPEFIENYSAELRNTVAWCMEHNPTERPSLNRLGQIVERNTTRDFPDQPDAATRRLVSDLFGTPLPPTRK